MINLLHKTDLIIGLAFLVFGILIAGLMLMDHKHNYSQLKYEVIQDNTIVGYTYNTKNRGINCIRIYNINEERIGIICGSFKVIKRNVDETKPQGL